MKRLFIAFMIFFGALAASAQTWFPYPVAPENLPIGRPRANYLVEHFWDRCPWKSAYSSPQKMEQSIRDFADYLPHASADTVFQSIDHLIKQSQKKPADFEKLLKMAEATFFADTASKFSDRVYLPFAEAGAGFKKFRPEQRAYYERQARIINNSMVNSPVPDLRVTAADGSTHALNDTTAGVQTYILIFERPDADRFDRIRFAANISVGKLVDAGLIQPILICAGEADAAWWKAAENLPRGWKAMALANAADLFDLRQNPSVYLADGSMKIISRQMPLGLLTANCEQLVISAGL